MLIEITGGFGSGKSALAEVLSERLTAEGYSAVIMRSGGRLAADPFAIPLAPLFALRHPRLWRLLLWSTNRDADSWRARSALMWNLMRKAGVHERLKKRSSNQVVIWDEGTVHMAHNAFAHIRSSPRESEVLEFGELVPKPDLLVLVKAPAELARRRVISRGHKRTGGDRRAVEALLSNADQVFAWLAQVESIRDRMLEVDNDSPKIEDLKVPVEAIVAVVRQSEHASRR